MDGREHADLLLDVGPVAGGLTVDEALEERLAHVDDAVRHACRIPSARAPFNNTSDAGGSSPRTLDLAKPLPVEGLVPEDGADEARAVDGRVGVEGADDDLDLRVDALALVGVGAHDREGADALAVEAHVLCERLAEHDLVALRDKVPEREGVVRRVARGEACGFARGGQNGDEGGEGTSGGPW